jgi:hypothetical protein
MDWGLMIYWVMVVTGWRALAVRIKKCITGQRGSTVLKLSIRKSLVNLKKEVALPADKRDLTGVKIDKVSLNLNVRVNNAVQGKQPRPLALSTEIAQTKRIWDQFNARLT